MKRAMAALVGTALFLGMIGGPATAQVVDEVPTQLKFRVTDKTPNYKARVDFTANLSASRQTCYASRPVKLIRNGEVMRSKQTNDNGRVRWKNVTIRANGKWKTKFLGRTFGHPENVICLASTSRVITIRVQNKP